MILNLNLLTEPHMTRLLSTIFCAIAVCILVQPIESSAQTIDVWSNSECSLRPSKELLLTKEAKSSKFDVPRLTFKISENFREDILIQSYNPMRYPLTENHIVGSPEELELWVNGVLLSELHSQNNTGIKNSFSYHKNAQSNRPCTSIISAMINALQTARDSVAFHKSGFSEGQLQSACSTAESPILIQAYLNVLKEVDHEMPGWTWVEYPPLPTKSPQGATTIEILGEEERLPQDEAGEEVEEVDEEDIPFMIVEDMPRFGPCISKTGPERDQCTQLEIIKYVTGNTKYPPIAKDAGIQGTVFVYFVVGKDGKVREGRVLRPVDPRLDAEALRVVTSLPDFEPGRQQGKPVSVQFTIPVKFVIRAEQKERP